MGAVEALLRGYLVVFEGIDKSGKTTQSELLAKRLKADGFQVEAISFPVYTTPLGKEIKAFLTSRRDYPSQVRHMLYAANRWEMEDRMSGWTSQGKLVVVNRYSASNLAYGSASGLPSSWLEGLEEGLPQPNLTLLIDISPETSFERKDEEGDIFEKDLKFLARVREEYVKLSKRRSWMVVNGEDPVDKVWKRVWKAISDGGFLKKMTRQ